MIERFRNATSAQQLFAVLLVGTVVALLLAVLWFQFLRVNYKTLVSQLQPADAAAIIAELEKRKIPYQLAEGGKSILVPAAEVDAARVNLAGDELPIKGAVGFELFNKSDLGLTDFAQKINYQRALQGELARTIMSLDGVDGARVHLSLGEDRVFRDDRVPPKASVTVHMENGRPIGDREADGIRRIVAAAVPQLDVAQVVVVDETGEVMEAAVSAQPATVLSPFMQEKRAIEQYYEARIRQAIAARYPSETIDVRVWADGRIAASNEAAKESGLQEDRVLWTEGVRDFPLQVTLSPERAMSQEILAELRQLAGAAIGYDATLGDAVTFGAALPPANVLSRTDSGARRTPFNAAAENAETGDEPTSPRWSQLSMMLLALAVLILLGLFAMRQRRLEPRMSPEQREAFAAKLEGLLEEGGPHV